MRDRRTKIPTPGTEEARRVLTAGLLVLAVLLLQAAPARAQLAPAPDEHWLTFQTPSFQVVFPEGLEELAVQAAMRGEEALEALAEWGESGFGTRPPGRIQLVITDHADLSNGFASSIPLARIVIWARPPIHGPDALPHDDWLNLVMTHEVIHILHGEMTSGLGHLARRVLGRPPLLWPFFPALVLPSWGLEGVAVTGESALTRGGRIHGTRAEAVLRAQALEGRLERLDQVLANSPTYPAGDRPYSYGGRFFHDVLDDAGSDVMNAWTERQARRINPLRLDRTTREVMGASLQTAHARWRDGVMEKAREFQATSRARRPHPDPELLGVSARRALHPVFHPQRGDLAWVESDGIDGPALMMRPGGVDGETRRVARLNDTGVPAWQTGPGQVGLWVTDLVFDGPWRLRSEVVEVRPDASRWNRRTVLTSGGRIASLAALPGGGGLVAVREVPGTNELILLDAEGNETAVLVEGEAGVLWAHPVVAPSGRHLAVLRWRVGGWWEIVLMPLPVSGMPVMGTGDEAVVIRGRAPASGPTWGPGGTHLLWSSERSGVSALYGVSVDPATGEVRGPIQQVTDLAHAVGFPAVDPEGEWIVFSILRADGWTLARLPWDPSNWFDPLPEDRRFSVAGDTLPVPAAVEVPMVSADAAGFGAVTPWSGGSTLRPRYLLPVAHMGEHWGGSQVMAHRLGVRSGARDVVERTRWDAELLAPVGSGVSGWEGAATLARRGVLGGTLVVGAGQGWTVVGQVALPPSEGHSGQEEDVAPDPLFVVARDRQARVRLEGMSPGFGLQMSGAVELAGLRQTRRLVEPDGSATDRAGLLVPERDLAQASVVIGMASLRGGALSPGPRRGVATTMRLRARRDVAVPDSLRGRAGLDGGLREAIGEVRGYIPLARGRGRGPARARGTGSEDSARPGSASVGPLWRGDPVVALRVGAGWAGGPGAGLGHFSVGGSGLGPFRVRGTPEGITGGRRVWAGTVEGRIPLALVHRGLVRLPLHLDRVHGVAFVDWARVEGASTGGGLPPSARAGRLGPETLATLGAEVVITSTVLFESMPLVRLGGALRLDGEARGRPAGYAALGWSF